ncbi:MULTISPECIES: hypothetical protein [Streptomyces]|uniref:hypothetical protein n=1 Tax=Streptomyces TaxID=1883 RepID=UPI000AAFB149|nr:MULTISPECIES: hypothetical protein [Streptomyces]MDX3608926.1 hypothetical protein [Streptomyces sp. FL06-04B]MDX3739639.1 hypothetical protein [Streptomyces sp. ID01-15D]
MITTDWIVPPSRDPSSTAITHQLGRLMRLFGITEKTAMHYLTTAHPERTAKLPK